MAKRIIVSKMCQLKLLKVDTEFILERISTYPSVLILISRSLSEIKAKIVGMQRIKASHIEHRFLNFDFSTGTSETGCYLS